MIDVQNYIPNLKVPSIATGSIIISPFAIKQYTESSFVREESEIIATFKSVKFLKTSVLFSKEVKQSLPLSLSPYTISHDLLLP